MWIGSQRVWALKGGIIIYHRPLKCTWTFGVFGGFKFIVRSTYDSNLQRAKISLLRIS